MVDIALNGQALREEALRLQRLYGKPFAERKVDRSADDAFQEPQQAPRVRLRHRRLGCRGPHASPVDVIQIVSDLEVRSCHQRADCSLGAAGVGSSGESRQDQDNTVSLPFTPALTSGGMRINIGLHSRPPGWGCRTADSYRTLHGWQ